MKTKMTKNPKKVKIMRKKEKSNFWILLIEYFILYLIVGIYFCYIGVIILFNFVIPNPFNLPHELFIQNLMRLVIILFLIYSTIVTIVMIFIRASEKQEITYVDDEEEVYIVGVSEK